MSDRLLLVDGMNLHFQMFFGMPARILNSKGKAIQGVMGFVGAIRKIVEMTKPTHVLVVFDGEHHNPRTDLDAEYKSNRPDYSELPAEENPFDQLPDVYAALDAMGIAHCETLVCEADDLIASYVKEYEHTHDMTICSFDSDFFQLIGPNVRVLRYRGERSVFCDQDYLRAKYGIEGTQYVDFKSLTGDNADNIRGIDGVGPKTASRLINRYGDIEKLIEECGSLENERLRRLVECGTERFRLNRKLITMDSNQNLPYSIELLGFSGSIPKTRDVLTSIGLL
ncbi:MAG: 5'-3' exonuclease [Spirochaetales bacterium]|nr:5'-3' exonuclease [Spirochaetales bacterium]